MTTLQSFAQKVATWSNWRIPQLKNNIFKAQNIPHKSTKIMASNNASQFYKITIHPICSKPPKIDHAKYVLAMCYSFFSLLSFCYRAYWSVNPWGTCFTWLYPRRVAFQFNQEPSWLPRYRHLAFSKFVSLRQITHESKTSLRLKDSTKYRSRSRLSFLYSINLEL